MDNDSLHNVQHFILEHAFIVTYLHSLFRDLQNTLQHRPPTSRQYIKVEIYYPADMNDYFLHFRDYFVSVIDRSLYTPSLFRFGDFLASFIRPLHLHLHLFFKSESVIPYMCIRLLAFNINSLSILIANFLSFFFSRYVPSLNVPFFSFQSLFQSLQHFILSMQRIISHS